MSDGPTRPKRGWLQANSRILTSRSTMSFPHQLGEVKINHYEKYQTWIWLSVGHIPPSWLDWENILPTSLTWTRKALFEAYTNLPTGNPIAYSLLVYPAYTELMTSLCRSTYGEDIFERNYASLYASGCSAASFPVIAWQVFCPR